MFTETDRSYLNPEYIDLIRQEFGEAKSREPTQ